MVQQCAAGDAGHTSEEESSFLTKGWHEVVNTVNAFGPCFVVYIFLALVVNPVVAKNLGLTAADYLFKELHVPSSLVQILKTIISLPFSLVFVFAVTVDAFPILGYRYALWLISAVVIGCVCNFLLFSLSISVLTAFSLTKLLTLLKFEDMIYHIAVRSKLAQKFRQHATHAVSMTIFLTTSTLVVELIAKGLYVPVTQNGQNHQGVYLVSAFTSAIVLFATVLNFHDEERITDEMSAEFRRKLLSAKEICVVGVTMTGFAVFAAFAQLFLKSAVTRFISILLIAIFLVLAINMVLGPEIARPLTFKALSIFLHVNLESAAFYFYTDTKEQYTRGPNFSIFFYVTVNGYVSSLLLAVFALMFCIKAYTITYQSLWKMLLLGKIFGTMLVMVIYSRANIVLGVPDHVIFIFSEIVVLAFREWNLQASAILALRLVPRDMEATLLSFEGVCRFLSSELNRLLGAVIMEFAGITPRADPSEDAAFQNMWKVKSLDLLFLAILYILVPLLPTANLTENILSLNAESPIAGSWLSQWRAKSNEKTE